MKWGGADRPPQLRRSLCIVAWQRSEVEGPFTDPSCVPGQVLLGSGGSWDFPRQGPGPCLEALPVWGWRETRNCSLKD